MGKAKYFPLPYLWKLLAHVHFFYLNKEAKPLQKIFLHRQFSVSISIKRLKWVVYIKRVMKPYLCWDYSYAGKHLMKEEDWLPWQPYIYAANHHCAPPVSTDGSPLFSFIQPTTASCASSDSTLPCPSLSPSESQRKERFPWTCPSSAALEYLPFPFSICQQKLLHFSMVSLFFCSNVCVTTNATTLYQTSQASSFLYCKAPCDRDTVSRMSAVWKKRLINTLNSFFQTSVLAEEWTWGKDALAGSSESMVFLGDSLLTCTTALWLLPHRMTLRLTKTHLTEDSLSWQVASGTCGHWGVSALTSACEETRWSCNWLAHSCVQCM